MALYLQLEYLGDIQRRAVQPQALQMGLEPADILVALLRADQHLQLAFQGLAARQTGIQSLPPTLEGLEQRPELPQLLKADVQRLQRGAFRLDLGPCPAAQRLAECQTQLAGRPRDVIEPVQQLRHIAGLAVVLDLGIARQLQQLTGADGVTEEIARHLGQLVCLVDDKRIRTGQQFAETVVFDRKIGAQQVMIDHHDVGLLRTPARLDQMTLAPRVARLAQTVVAGRGHQRPDRRVLGHVTQLADIAALGQA